MKVQAADNDEDVGSFAESKLIIFFPLGFIISVVFLLCNKLGCGSNVYTRSTPFLFILFLLYVVIFCYVVS